jgi:4-diphosphocytidyl-2-C-methyl-D-erythritol kinase
VLSPAKINWTLQILGRRADGFHELRSWFLALDWGDDLQFHSDRNLQQSTLEIQGPRAAGIPTDASNLLLQAEAQWREAGGVAPFGRWELEKHIPAEAGLGGGSSNAAIALHLLQNAAIQSLPETECRKIAQRIGSDVDFFWQRQSAELRGGRGEVVMAFADAPPIYIVLALSDLHAATAIVYAALNAGPIAEECEPVETEWPSQPGNNDLQAAALQCVPGLQELGNRLNQQASFTMSGSGSSYFAACFDAESAQQLAREVEPLLQQAVVCRPLLRSNYSN